MEKPEMIREMIRGFDFEDKEMVCECLGKLIDNLWDKKNVEKMSENDRKIFVKDLETLLFIYFEGRISYCLGWANLLEMDDENAESKCW